MRIPFIYTWRSLWTRHMTTILTLCGIALVVFVFAAVLMLANGLEKTLVETGDPQNVIAVRRAANSELVSQMSRETAQIFKTQPEIALLPDGAPIASTEVYVIINLIKKESNDMGNISVRGISPAAMQLREDVNLIEGRMFHFGTHEIIIGSNIFKRFQDCDIGKQIKFGGDLWTIVGHFDAKGSAFESEIWGDVEQLMPAFGRPVFSSMTFRLTDPEALVTLKTRMEKDPRTQYVDLKPEQQYYRDQSKLMSDFIKILGLIVTIIFSIGAMIGAMITMYAAVSNRTTEIGTLRALGFRRRNVLGSFVVESLLLSILGGSFGIILASVMSFVSISTTNWGTFSELAFGFSMSPAIVIQSLLFSICMGIAGGISPAVRAARMEIVNALRAT